MYYFIVNVSARTGKAAAIWDEVKQVLKNRGVDYKAYKTQGEAHATRLAREITSRTEGETTLIVVGGDGTINEVINGIFDFSKVRFGFIPTGSGNDLGRGLGISVSPKEMMERILDDKECMVMDLGLVTMADTGASRYFAISSGIGLDAYVCEKSLTSKAKKVLNSMGLGKLTYVLLTLCSLFSMHKAKLSVTVDDEKPVVINQMIFAAAMNHVYEGGGVPMAPAAKADDGYLSMCMVYGYNSITALFALPSLLAGKHQKKKGFWLVNCKKCVISIDKPMTVHTDGEVTLNETKVTFSILPGALKILGVSSEK